MSENENTPTRNRRKARVGVVVSDKMDKTRVVAIERMARHRLYGRAIRRTKRFTCMTNKISAASATVSR